VIVDGGFIRVVQDVRGKHGSEGDYVMARPLAGPQNPTPVDHATDTYDTIEWLVKNVPESNGKVGIIGVSYDGFLPLMALVNPHPALKVAVPMNPMVDGWRGDDWFHNGAFRQEMLSYMYEQQAAATPREKWWTSHYDDYDMFMKAGSAGEAGRLYGLEQTGFWRKVLAHPAYDAFWADQAMDRILGAQPAQGSGDARAQPVGSGGHLRRARGLSRDRAEGHRERQGLPGDGPVASRSGDGRSEYARRAALRSRYRTRVPPRHPASLPESVSAG
jgi:hypothetical protein